MVNKKLASDSEDKSREGKLNLDQLQIVSRVYRVHIITEDIILTSRFAQTKTETL